MKRASVILLAAFYVLLSGGSYVCAVHCAATSIIAPKVSDCCHKMGKMPMSCHKPVDKENDCNKKHSNFVLKENLKPSFSFSALKQIALINLPSFKDNSTLNNFATAALIYQQSKAPPPLNGRSYIIRLRTFLI